MTATLQDAALEYAATGWAVFPVEPRGKRPVGHLVPNGLHNATRDPETIRRWWTAVPDANIGVPTGDQFDVIDCDGHGIEVFLTWCEEHDVGVDDFPRAVTGRADGGRHVLIAPTGIGNRTAVLEGVDFRGKGGYIVTPPSIHASGLSYAWKVEPNGAIPAISAAFLELLASPAPATRSRVTPVPPPPMGSTPYGMRALDDELRLLSTARNGERNDQLNHRAFRLYQLVFGGELNESSVETGLMATAQALGLTDREIAATMKSAREAATKSPRGPAPQQHTNGQASPVTPAARPVRARCLEEVELETTEWLWRRRIPLAKVTVIDGMPGLGKSVMHLDLAARVSRGLPMPDGTPTAAGAVLILAAEDGLGDTVKPRLMAAGADLRRIRAYGIDDERLPLIPDDLERLEAEVMEFAARFVILDPLFAFVSARAKSISDQEMRQAAMTPLARLAKRTGAAVVLIRHLSKDRDAEAIARGAGSMGIIGAARAAFLVGVDPDDPDRRVLATTKANNSAKAPSLSFRIAGSDDDAAPCVVWEGVSHLEANELLARPPSAEDRSAMGEAKAFLRELLGDHALHPQQGVERAAAGAGIAKRTLVRAKAATGVVARKSQGVGGPWMWQIPWPPGQEPQAF